MGLVVEEDPIEDPKERGNDNGSSMKVGSSKAGKTNSEGKISLVEGNKSIQENEIERGDIWKSNLELEEELNHMLLHRKKKKGDSGGRDSGEVWDPGATMEIQDSKLKRNVERLKRNYGKCNE
ncbi:hypothetical protein PVK06_018157 [Gossypium arboreum]|uniref:Uncharacterized protein n=1 Tax=Gossypium arboreum TaxID=29729 RepID=A0ABR0Q4L7_GOSAR|nr:hypothetical protein PVK06_018157 [Gossypium arboreum]